MAQQGVLGMLVSTGCWKLFPFLLIYSTGFAALFPVIPTLVTNGFASQTAGHPIDCQQFTPDQAPEACRNAHSQAVTWNSWTSFVSGSILSFIFAPTVGNLSDHWGRKPFILAGVLMALLPMLTLMVHLWGWIPIEWYYPMSALNGIVSSFSMTLASVADLLPQCHRATAVGYLSAAFSLGILVGPLLGGSLDAEQAVYVCISMIILTLLYILLFVPETAPRCRARQALQRLSEEKQAAAAGSGSDSTAATAGPQAAAPGKQQPPQQSSRSSYLCSCCALAACRCQPASQGGQQEQRVSIGGGEGRQASGCSAVRKEADSDPALLTVQLHLDPVPNVVPHFEHASLEQLDAGGLHRSPCCSGAMCACTCGCVAPVAPGSGTCEGCVKACCGSSSNGKADVDVERDVAPQAAASCCATTPSCCATNTSTRAANDGASKPGCSGCVTDAGPDELCIGCGVCKVGCQCALSDEGQAKQSTGLQARMANMLAGFHIIRNSPWYRKLAVIWVIVAMTWEGAQDMLFQYLQLQLGFTTADQSHALILVAACGLFIKLALLATLVKVLGERWLLVMGLTAYAAEVLLLAHAPTKWFALLAIGVGSASCVCWPATVALQTSRVNPLDLGAVSGALSGISSLATGIGPIFFAALFSAVSRTDSSLPNMPYIVWYVAAAMTSVAILLTISLAREPESKLPSAAASAHPSTGGAPAGPQAYGTGAREGTQAHSAKSRAANGTDEDSMRAPLLAGDEAA